MDKKNRFWILVGILIIVIWGLNTYAKKNVEYNGSVIEPATPAYQFSLSTPDGGEYKLADSLGKVVLIFFGYTNCPDFCPTTLNDFKIVKSQLGSKADDIEILFVSIDPDRDTPEMMWNYTNAFDESFIGLGGTEEELQPIWANYWVYRAIGPGGAGENYLMSHSTRVIVIDTEGNFRMTFPNGMEPIAMISDIQNLLAE